MWHSPELKGNNRETNEVDDLAGEKGKNLLPCLVRILISIMHKGILAAKSEAYVIAKSLTRIKRKNGILNSARMKDGLKDVDVAVTGESRMDE